MVGSRARSLNTGKVNTDQSTAADKMLAAVAGDLARDTDGAMDVDRKAPPSTSTASDPLGLSCKSGCGRGRFKS